MPLENTKATLRLPETDAGFTLAERIARMLAQSPTHVHPGSIAEYIETILKEDKNLKVSADEVCRAVMHTGLFRSATNINMEGANTPEPKGMPTRHTIRQFPTYTFFFLLDDALVKQHQVALDEKYDKRKARLVEIREREREREAIMGRVNNEKQQGVQAQSRSRDEMPTAKRGLSKKT